jgi:hypothetical protein
MLHDPASALLNDLYAPPPGRIDPDPRSERLPRVVTPGMLVGLQRG